MFGFRFKETMRGTFHLLDTPLDERAIEFSIEVDAKGLRRFMKERVARIHGLVNLEGLAHDKPPWLLAWIRELLIYCASAIRPVLESLGDFIQDPL